MNALLLRRRPIDVVDPRVGPGVNIPEDAVLAAGSLRTFLAAAFLYGASMFSDWKVFRFLMSYLT